MKGDALMKERITSTESASRFLTNINVLSNVTKSLKFLGRPGTRGSLHGIPDLIQGFEPGVGRTLVSNTSPNSLLHIQSWLIGGQIVQGEPGVSPQELAHGFAFVPAGAIDIERDLVAPQAPIKITEHRDEAVAIAVFGAVPAVGAGQG